MNFDYIGYKENQHIIPFEIPNKEEYYRDLMNIENSWTGRLDAQITNTFVLEAVQLIINAIVLFEKGYFDCAYYSLRQSLELSTTMVYLTELDAEKKDSALSNWKNQSRFPMYGKMIEFLKDNQNVFGDMKTQMNEYFEELHNTKERLNKYVHKQGFNTFYISRSHILRKNKDDREFVEDFENSIKRCIGAIAVFRLAIDPFPVLLMDSAVFCRTGDTLTEPFSDDFIDKYIGMPHIESFKSTVVYKSIYDSVLLEEEKFPSVIDLVKHQYIDKEKIDEILSQIHLISKSDLLAVITSSVSDKVSRIYCHDGLLYYFTSTKSIRTNLGLDSRDFMRIKESNDHINIEYDEAFITYIKNQDLFIEHNVKFVDEELNTLQHLFKIMV